MRADLLAQVARLRRHTHIRVFGSYAITQGVIFSTSLARIPLIVAAIGPSGYGVAVAVSSIQAWVVIIILSVTHLTQVSVSEDLGRKDPLGIAQTIAELRQKARKLMLGLAIAGIVLAVALPWSQLLHAQSISSALTIRLAIAASMFLLASCAPGAVYLGVLNAQKKVALTQSFPAMGAVASLAVTAVGWSMHLGIAAFVVAPAVSACIPFWIGRIWGRRALRSFSLPTDAATPQQSPARSSKARGLRPRDFLILTGVAAPPLFSTGLDPIVLGISRGPGAVAAYGLATRLSLLVTMLPAALYPLYWSTFSRLRAEGNIRGIFALYRKELVLMVAGTSVLGVFYIGAAPFVANVLSNGRVERPMLLYLSVAVLGLLSAVQSVTLPLLAGSRTAPKTALLVFGLIIPNEALSYELSHVVGAAGPILASIVATLVLLGICGLMIKRNPLCVVDGSEGVLDPIYGRPLDPWQPIRIGEGVPGRPYDDADEVHGLSGIGRSPQGGSESRGLRPILLPQAVTANVEVLSDTARQSGVGEAAVQARRRWRKASWFAVATYFAWSPVSTINKFLPSGSTTRGAVLTLIPLIGVVAVMNLPKKRPRRSVDLVVVLLAALIVWQGISVETTAGFQFFLHVGPATALLLLAVVSRGEYSDLSLKDIRFAITGVLSPLCFLLLAGWVAQYGRLVPVAGPAGSTFGLAVHGFRLQGLTSGPNLLGFLAAITTLIAFVAQPGTLAWFTRILGGLSLLASDSRTSMIVLGIGLLALWVLGPGRSMSQRLTAFAGVALGGLAARGIIFKQRSDNTDVLSNRDQIWRDLIPYLHHLPLFGNGPNFLPKLVPLVFGPFAVSGQILDPQNQWLNDAIEFGFVSAILLTLFLFAIPLKGSHTYRMVLLIPLLLMVIVECFSEVPLAVFGSIDGAFPLFFLVMWAPLRRMRTRPEYPIASMRTGDKEMGQPGPSASGGNGTAAPALI